MKIFIALTIASTLMLSGCSKPPKEEEEKGEAIILSVDCTAEALTGKDANVSGRDFLRSAGSLVALGSSVEWRVRDEVGWMIFLLPFDWNPHGVKVDMMLAKFQAEGVILNGSILSDAEFADQMGRYGTTVKMLGSQGVMIVHAEQDCEIGDCVKYLRVIYDAGIDQLLLPKPSWNDPIEQKKVLKTVP